MCGPGAREAELDDVVSTGTGDDDDEAATNGIFPLVVVSAFGDGTVATADVLATAGSSSTAG